jgi:ribosomal protein S18 acetylase RimI-like enzyme
MGSTSRIHTSLPEKPEVFAEKFRLFPDGCQKLVSENKMVGYGISHPWVLSSIPPLDEFLVLLPQNPECIYIHDVVVLPEARGNNAAQRYVDHIKRLAAKMSILSLALVSVYGTDALWNRFGFRAIQDDGLKRKLISYGVTAKYMICNLND